MEIVIEMACSINGLIAGEDGNEDFLLHRNYEIMIELLQEYDVLVWGSRTLDNVLSWGVDYIDDLKDIKVIILSKEKKSIDLPNVVVCNSLEECLSHCENNNYKKVFVGGGATTNNLFMERNIVDKIILNYNPHVLNKGIPLFKGNYFSNKLRLNKVVHEKEDIVQIHYDVIK